MKTQQHQQACPAKKLALAALGVVLPLATLGASLPASANGHFQGMNLSQSSSTDHRTSLDVKSDDKSERRRSHRFIFIGDHLFEHYDLFYRLDDDSAWIQGESYRSREDAELEVRRLEHKGYIVKLVRE